ncbi:MAG: recombinase family protein [Oscillospiraceae bacterium]|nr:recombinase family protein [Oscillospiraceae bacterium]
MGRRDRVAQSTERYLKRTHTTEWKTALYARLSDENNGFEDDRSLQNQIMYLEEYIDKHPDLALADRYVDNGRSGMNFERAEFQRMMEDVKDGKINCIVVKDLSRFGRNHIEAGYYLETIFPQLDIRFISINDNFDSMDESKKDGMMVPLKNMINEMYAKDTQRKVLATLRAQESRNQKSFTAAPYGYIIDPECKYHLLPDPETADYVRLIFSLKAGGLGLTAIANRLNQIGAPTPLEHMKSQGKYTNVQNGAKWNHKLLYRIIENRTYTGATVYNTMGKGEYKVIPNTHEALADEAIFESISTEMAERSKIKKEELKKGRSRAEKYPNILKGVFYCGDCGRAMFLDKTGFTRVLRNFRYRCSSYNDYKKDDEGAPPCAITIHSVSDHTVYKFVLDQIRLQLKAGLELEKLETLLQAETKKKKKESDAQKAQEASIKQKLRKLYEDYADKIITEEEYLEIRATYLEKLKAIQEQPQSSDTDLWLELKKKLFGEELGSETVGTVQLTEHSSVEIVADDEPDMVERLLRKGLTRELVEAMVERLEYSVDGSFFIKFKCEDYVEKLLTMKGE